MTATQTSPAPPLKAVPASTSVSPLRRLSVFGTGFGVAVAGDDMEAVIVRSRPSGSVVVASTVIRRFAGRPAAEWGAEISQFLAGPGEPRLAATLVLPREEVIVRTLRLAGVADKDTASAIGMQLDTMHPWDEEPVEWSWWRVSPSDVVVGVVRQSTLSHYENLFSEAGIPLAAATFSSAAIYRALRLQRTPPASTFCYATNALGRIEVYGESEAKPCYSAGFSLPVERALSLARAELRFSPESTGMELGSALAAPADVSPGAYAAALAASAPLFAQLANLLPAERRASHSRTRYLIPAALGTLVLAGLLAVFVVFPILNERRYVSQLNAEERRLQPSALRVQSIDKALAADRTRVASLDDFRRRPQADLDVLNELVRVLPEKVWTNSIEIFPDSVVIAGEADQAAPLLKLLDSSPFFQNSEFVMSVTRNGEAEQFRIKTMRRGRAGRSTP